MQDRWLDTTAAAAELGVHPHTLKRKRDISGGFLESSTHYRFKTPSSNSAILWNVDAIQALFHERAIKARQEVSHG